MSEVAKSIPREAIRQAVEVIAALPGQIQPEMMHYFAHGVYCRQMKVPAGIVLAGKIHKHDTLNILLQGEIEVAMEHGGTSVMKAPLVFVSAPGVQKIARTITETIWLNVHGTDETDLSVIEKIFTADSYEEYDLFLGQQKALLGGAE